MGLSFVKSIQTSTDNLASQETLKVEVTKQGQDIAIELDDHVIRELAELAASAGQTLQEYVWQVIVEAADGTNSP